MFAESLMMLRPWQLWSLEGEPAPGTPELVAVLESVLKRDPDHPGANHFYIHAVEASRNLERAIPSAMRLMTLTPGAGHLVHMPGHIFLQTGDFDLAAETNVKASEADRAFIERTGATGVYPLMYWTHNIHFIAYARAQQGRYEEAKQAAEEMVGNIGDGDLEMQMLEGFLLDPLMTDLRFHKWDEILGTPAPKTERKLSRAFWQYARAMALAGKGKLDDAIAERTQFEALRKSVPAESMYLLNNKSSDVLALAAATLDAQLAWARGEKETSIKEWRRAIDFCMKCEGDTCWVAPSSPRCWAVNSSDSVPVLKIPPPSVAAVLPLTALSIRISVPALRRPPPAPSPWPAASPFWIRMPETRAVTPAKIVITRPCASPSTIVAPAPAPSKERLLVSVRFSV